MKNEDRILDLFKEKLLDRLGELSQIAVDEKKLHMLSEHFRLLKTWNEVHNLTSVKDEESLVAEHYLDCIMALSIWAKSARGEGTVWDLGSGNGFPGLIGAVLFAEKTFFLVESSRKKCSFLRAAVARLEIENCFVKQQRVEELSGLESGITRAAFSESKLNDLSLAFKENGQLALMTVPGFPIGADFFEQSPWQLSERHNYSLSTGAKRSVVVLKKHLRST